MVNIRCFIFLVFLLGISCIHRIFFLRTTWSFSNTNVTLLSTRLDQPADNFTYCLLDAQRAFTNLSLPWFVAFGTALKYYRSNNFVSDDIDIGIFIDDLRKTNTSDTKFISIIHKYGFKLRSSYGNMTHGQGWTLECPRSTLHFGIFIFYHSDPINNETFSWWTASYNGACNQMRYHKCRWWFSTFQLNTFEMYNQQFHIVPRQFLTEQYGSKWMMVRKYGYFESLKFLPNLIDEH
jgi:hypothetical protein